MNIKMLILITLHGTLFFGSLGYAQIYAPTEELEKQYRPPLSQEGRLVSVQFVPAANDVRVYIAGKDADRFLAPSDVDFRAYIQNAEELTPVASSREGNFFTVAVDPDRTPNLGIEVRYKGDVETFNTNLQPPPPVSTRTPAGER